MGPALDIPFNRTYPGHAEVGYIGCPSMADTDQHWGVGVFRHLGIIFLYQDLQDLYVDVWEETRSSGDHPRSENCLKPAMLG